MSSSALSLSVDELYAKWCGPREFRPIVSSREVSPVVTSSSIENHELAHGLIRDENGSESSLSAAAALHRRLSRSLVDRIAALEARTTTLPVVAARTGPVGGSPNIVHRSASSLSASPPAPLPSLRDDVPYRRPPAELSAEHPSSLANEPQAAANRAATTDANRRGGEISAHPARQITHELDSEADLVEQIMRLHRENLRLRRNVEELTAHQDEAVDAAVAQLRDKHRQCELQWHREREFLVERLMRAEADQSAAAAVAEARANSAKRLQEKVDEAEERAQMRERELLATIAVMEREKTLRELQCASSTREDESRKHVASSRAEFHVVGGGAVAASQADGLSDAPSSAAPTWREPWRAPQPPAHHPSVTDACRQCALTNERLERARRELEEATHDWCNVAHQVAEYATTVLEDVKGECSTLLLAAPRSTAEQPHEKKRHTHTNVR